MATRRLQIEKFEDRLTMDISAAAAQLVYELNLARHNPVAYAQERGLSVSLSGITPRAPLAINDSLVAAASDHASEMSLEDYLAHQSPVDDRWPNQMARDADYLLPAAWESDANFIEAIAGGEDLLFPTGVLDQWLSATSPDEIANRNLLLGVGAPYSDFSEVGASYASNFNSTLRNYWSLQAAYSNLSDVFLTGFVYDDRNGDNRFDADEGMAGVTIESGPLSTVTGAAGNWTLKVAGGAHTVQASGGGLSQAKTVNVVVGTENVQIDFRETGPVQVNFSSNSSWTNSNKAVDVDGNGVISPLDALLVINRLNLEGSHLLPTPGAEPPPYLDTNGDGSLSPLDALLVINHLNRFGAG